MKYRILEIAEPFKRKKYRVQTSWFGLVWENIIDSHELPVELDSLEKARAWIAEYKSGRTVRVHNE